MNIELFPCSGGMAEGFRRAGVRFNFVVDKDPDAAASYARNLGHAPVLMDVHDLLRMVRAGWACGAVNFLCADPPCTPWSRAGKRLGLADERDCLRATADLIALLRPSAYLIGNVPGLQDSTQWRVVQEVIGGLAREGYCVRDYACFDCADYGVPQHRVRPFWFGHLGGECIRWPAPTHGRSTAQVAIGGHALLSWVTCRQALGHLLREELGREVRMVIRPKGQDGTRHGGDDTRCSSAEEPARTVVTRDQRKGGQILLRQKGKGTGADETKVAHEGIKGGGILIVRPGAEGKHPVARIDGQAPTVRGGGRGHSALQVVLAGSDSHPVSDADAPAMTVTARAGATSTAAGGGALRNWDNHPPSRLDEPAMAIKTNGDRMGTGGGATLALQEREQTNRGRNARDDDPAPTVTTNDMGEGVTLEVPGGWPWNGRPTTTIAASDDRLPAPGHHASGTGHSTQHGANALILSERAAAILQGFPDGECTGHRGTVDEGDGRFLPDDDADLVADGIRPGERCGICGDVRRWHFSGKTKAARWSQLGQAIPPAMAEAVARAVVEQMRRA